MQKSCSADKSTMYVDNIRQSSERMREMLNTLLDFFRLDNGKEQPNLSPCRISAITHILETEFMPIAMNKGLTLIVESHTDAVVLTDKERILQIGNNLLSNAIKFTDNGSVSLAADYDNGLLKLIVEDTGTGMTEDEQQRVFGAFERLSNAAAKDGFGLGLSIVQRIVAMLGGTIRLESEKGKGSRFTVEIPMQTAEELPEQTIQAQMRHNHICHDVIAIDNDEVLLLMLKEMYAHEGMHCDTCTNVSVLMELIRKKEYSLLLTDLNMPEISGFELLELLRSSNVGNSKSIPIVVTTASGSCSKEELIERGFAGCLFKPFKSHGIKVAFYGYYYPSRYADLIDDEQRAFCCSLYQFKEGENHGIEFFKACMSVLNLADAPYHILFMPCSDEFKYARRFKRLDWYITTHRPDLSSGLYDVDVFESRDSLHEAKGGENRILERNYRITGNIEGKQIIIVDDVLTSGQSMADYKEEIERCGGKVVAAIFYGKTVTRPPLLLIKAHVWGGCIVNKIKELTK